MAAYSTVQYSTFFLEGLYSLRESGAMSIWTVSRTSQSGQSAEWVNQDNHAFCFVPYPTPLRQEWESHNSLSIHLYALIKVRGHEFHILLTVLGCTMVLYLFHTLDLGPRLSCLHQFVVIASVFNITVYLKIVSYLPLPDNTTFSSKTWSRKRKGNFADSYTV